VSVGETPSLIPLVALGVDLDLHVSDPSLAQLLRTLWADCLRPQGPELLDGCEAERDGPHTGWVRVEGIGPFEVVTASGRARCSGPSGALAATLAALNGVAIAATPYLGVHCAVVARDGRAVALPAPSGRGKTTTTVALLQRGWTYVSDEAMALGWDDGRLRAYPRPLAMSSWAAATLGVELGEDADGERVVTPTQLGTRATTPAEPLTVDAVVVLERTDGEESGPGRLVAADRAEGLTRLLPRCFNHFHDPARTLDVLRDLVLRSEVVTLHLGHPARSARTLERWLVG